MAGKVINPSIGNRSAFDDNATALAARGANGPEGTPIVQVELAHGVSAPASPLAIPSRPPPFSTTLPSTCSSQALARDWSGAVRGKIASPPLTLEKSSIRY